MGKAPLQANDEIVYEARCVVAVKRYHKWVALDEEWQDTCLGELQRQEKERYPNGIPHLDIMYRSNGEWIEWTQWDYYYDVPSLLTPMWDEADKPFTSEVRRKVLEWICEHRYNRYLLVLRTQLRNFGFRDTNDIIDPYKHSILLRNSHYLITQSIYAPTTFTLYAPSSIAAEFVCNSDDKNEIIATGLKALLIEQTKRAT